ncbi:branched-chain amino acid ABC transporter permease [bacterium]|nr:MAG: branched-chain amino acid ABC transporter permease [bacterium]
MHAALIGQLTIDGLLVGGVYALSALGLNVIFGVMRIVNLAHGEFVIGAALLSAVLFERWHANLFVVLPLAFVLAFGLGALIQRAFLRRLPEDLASAEATSLLMTFGLSYFFVGAWLTFFSGNFRSVPYLTGAWTLGPFSIAQARLAAFVASGIIAVLLALLLRYTALGRSIRATSQNVQGALACGVDVERVRTLSFALGTAIAAASGCLLILIFTVNPETGANVTLASFAVIALGGLGNYAGTLVGAAVIGLAVSFTGYFATAQVAQAAPYVLFILVLLLRPAGILGKSGA